MALQRYFFKLATLVSALYLNVLCADPKVEYYKNLINENIEKSKNFQPTNDRNVEFESGARLPTSEDYGTFDFIVVGAGSSGSVVASRLSEIQSFKTLLLEAGGEETDFSDIPNMNYHLWNSEMDWGYLTVPQKYTCDVGNGTRCKSPRGKVLGGTSTVNGAHYTRGNANDFDRWAKLGNTNWAFKHILKYFKKSENSQINGDELFHGKGGYLNVEYSIPDIDFLSNFVEAYRELGRRVNVDYNGRQQLGVGKTQFTTKEGKRQSTGRAFLSNARRRDNLKVATKAFVIKLIIEKQLKKANGVYFVKDGRKFKAFARNEVILSAGAYNTPQILILSGIGPKKHLNDIQVDTLIADLPVGENLIEHSALALTFIINQTVAELSFDEKLKQYLSNGTGPLSKTSTVDAISFESLKGVPKGVPMFEVIFNSKANKLTFDVLLQHPKSRGSIKLKSNDPIDHPLIDSNMIAHPEDRKNLREAIRFAFTLSRTRAFQKLNPVFKPATDSCGRFNEQSNHYWDCYMKHVIDFPCHPCSTTRMGVSTRDSVVDQDLRVHGVAGLRIADAGVIPSTMSGHINAVAIMIGEKCADLVKSQNGVFVDFQY